MKRLMILVVIGTSLLGCSNANDELLRGAKDIDAGKIVEQLREGRILESMVSQSGRLLAVSVKNVHCEGEDKVFDAVVEYETCLNRKYEFPIRVKKSKSGGSIWEYQSWCPMLEHDYFEMIRNQRTK